MPAHPPREFFNQWNNGWQRQATYSLLYDVSISMLKNVLQSTQSITVTANTAANYLSLETTNKQNGASQATVYKSITHYLRGCTLLISITYRHLTAVSHVNMGNFVQFHLGFLPPCSETEPLGISDSFHMSHVLPVTQQTLSKH